MKHTEYLKYYNREEYLFNDVASRFQANGYIKAFDFFCIVIWKSNRAKSKVSKCLLKQRHKDLDSAVKALTNAIYKATEPKSRLEIMIKKWKFRLPMASAVLTVLYPNDFTIYDVRVCESLRNEGLPDFEDALNKTSYEKLWARYEEYIKSVREAVTKDLSLRNKDRWLWGKSFASQLEKDIKNKFPKKAVHSKSKA